MLTLPIVQKVGMCVFVKASEDTWWHCPRLQWGDIEGRKQTRAVPGLRKGRGLDTVLLRMGERGSQRSGWHVPIPQDRHLFYFILVIGPHQEVNSAYSRLYAKCYWWVLGDQIGCPRLGKQGTSYISKPLAPEAGHFAEAKTGTIVAIPDTSLLGLLGWTGASLLLGYILFSCSSWRVKQSWISCPIETGTSYGHHQGFWILQKSPERMGCCPGNLPSLCSCPLRKEGLDTGRQNCHSALAL